MKKAFIGSRLRQLRRELGITQAAMAESLGISAAYVNMLEKNQRSLSVPVLMALSSQYGIDWQDVVPNNTSTLLADLRTAIQDPLFEDKKPDLDELRLAIDYAPVLATTFLKLYQSHRATIENIRRLGYQKPPIDLESLPSEKTTHDFFRNNGNHFDTLERAAEWLAAEKPCPPDEMYMMLKMRLIEKHGINVVTLPIDEMTEALRIHDVEGKMLKLSEALDFPNRTFQMAHTLCFVEFSEIMNSITKESSLTTKQNIERYKIELANYFAAALLMPYDRFLDLAEHSHYDIDRLASAFSVSFEQVCQRLTTLNRDTRRGVPFFFLRVDKAGNVTKRFNATTLTIAEYGESCPVKNLHATFRSPGVIMPELVELSEDKRIFTISRTTDRPVYSMDTQDRRQVISLGCDILHAKKLIYASSVAVAADAIFPSDGKVTVSAAAERLRLPSLPARS